MKVELTHSAAEIKTMSNGHTENILLIVVVQLIVIVASSRAFGMLFRRFGQPLVCGEIAAGPILGPPLFGGMFPALVHKVFDPSVSQIFSILSQMHWERFFRKATCSISVHSLPRSSNA
jgi:hypothetical protein